MSESDIVFDTDGVCLVNPVRKVTDSRARTLDSLTRAMDDRTDAVDVL